MYLRVEDVGSFGTYILNYLVVRPSFLGRDLNEGLNYGPVQTNTSRDAVVISAIGKYNIRLTFVKSSCKGQF